ncbi:MAG: anaerobic glycerol-3-phosphate dehydrogenase subunit C, partial [Bacteroidales bacterium]|nr:anaerobic glycerol-3-phosphate dehydrogenase subunit C [Bacteroidales bacterium]
IHFPGGKFPRDPLAESARQDRVRARSEPRRPLSGNRQDSFRRSVSYFHGCYVNYNYPELGKDFIKLMNACGYGVKLLEKEKCCGVALIANGFGEQARKQAAVNLDSIRKAGTEVLTTSSTCTFTMRDEYKGVLGIANDDVRDSILLAVKWLYDKVEAGEIKLAFNTDFKLKAVYHTPCHMQKIGWQQYSIRLLKQIPGLELTVLDQHCCGISGTFGFKKENYEWSKEIGQPLFQDIRNANPEAVITDCETCKWQIEAFTKVPVSNPISVLAQAIDFEKTQKLNADQ